MFVEMNAGAHLEVLVREAAPSGSSLLSNVANALGDIGWVVVLQVEVSAYSHLPIVAL